MEVCTAPEELKVAVSLLGCRKIPLAAVQKPDWWKQQRRGGQLGSLCPDKRQEDKHRGGSHGLERKAWASRTWNCQDSVVVSWRD